MNFLKKVLTQFVWQIWRLKIVNFHFSFHILIFPEKKKRTFSVNIDSHDFSRTHCILNWVYLHNHSLFIVNFMFYTVVEQGDDIHRIISDRTLVIANHQSTGDVPMLMTTFNAKPNVLPNLMWIMDSIFKFTNFGVVSMLHQDFFISSVSHISFL